MTTTSANNNIIIVPIVIGGIGILSWFMFQTGSNQPPQQKQQTPRIRRKPSSGQRDRDRKISDPISILSWNVCFGCMTNSSADISAYPLPKWCRQMSQKVNKPYVCMENVVKTLNTFGMFDIIALQEASNWSKMCQKLSSYKYVHSKSGKENMLTLYDPERFRIEAVCAGSIRSGRPIQIILFYDKSGIEKNIVFINLHNGHGIPADDLRRAIRHVLSKGGFVPHSRSVSNANEQQKTEDVIDRFTADDCAVIMAGDFNDHGRYDYWKKIQPFKNADFLDSRLENVKVSAKGKQPPRTCCNTKRRIRDSDALYGDYILIDEKSEFIISNEVLPDFVHDSDEFPTSDHLPVVAVVSIK